MDILGVGPIELILVLVIALIVVGPERLPEIARGIGKTWRQIHNMSRLVTAQWQEELTAAAELEAGKKGLSTSLAEPLKEARADLERVLTAPITTPIQTISNAKPAASGGAATPAPDTTGSKPVVETAPALASADAPLPAGTELPVGGQTGGGSDEATAVIADAGMPEPERQGSTTVAEAITIPHPDGRPDNGNQ